MGPTSKGEKEQALASLGVLAETCESALTAFAALTHSVSNTQTPAIETLRKDLLSLHRLVHTSATRLSVSLGKPPPSYAMALVPLKDLTSYVGQLVSCTSSFPPGVLRKEAVWASEEVVRALGTLVQHFETEFRRGNTSGDGYLSKTGALHDAVERAEKMSRDEGEAVSRAWRTNGESLDDSLKEVKGMMEEKNESEDDGFEDDGWAELGEGFGDQLKPEEMERVKKIYPLLRFTTLLHGRILSHHILKPPSSRPYPGSHLTNLLTLSNSLLPATDDLASALYGPQEVESIQAAAQVVHQITKDLERELATTEMDPEEATRTALKRLHLENGDGAEAENKTKFQKWFKQCFLQIDTIHNSLDFDT